MINKNLFKEGKYISSEKTSFGIEALFIDSNKNKFIALIPNDILIPLKKHESYRIFHDGTQALSLPGKFTNVFKIEKILPN